MSTLRPTKGTKVTATYDVTDADGVATDPTAVTVEFVAPSGASYTPTLDNPQVGRYVADFVPLEAGRWVVHAETSDPTNVTETSFYVVETAA